MNLVVYTFNDRKFTNLSTTKKVIWLILNFRIYSGLLYK